MLAITLFLPVLSAASCEWSEVKKLGTWDEYKAAAMSSDGSHMAVISESRFMNTSADGGVTWVANTGAWSNRFNFIAMSASGNKVAAINEFNFVDASFPGPSVTEELTWRKTHIYPYGGLFPSLNGRCIAVAMSADGVKISVADETKRPSLGSDGGATCTQVNDTGYPVISHGGPLPCRGMAAKLLATSEELAFS